MDTQKKKIYQQLYYNLIENIFYKIINYIIEEQNLSNIRKKKLKAYNNEIYKKLKRKIDFSIWEMYENKYNKWFENHYDIYKDVINYFYELCYNRFADSFMKIIENYMNEEIISHLNEKLELIIQEESLETHKNKDNNQSNLTNDETNHNIRYDNNSKNIENEYEKSNEEEMQQSEYLIPINKKSKIDEQDKENNKRTPKISLGINIGSLNTVYSKFDKIDGKFKTNVLLSDVSKRVIPSQICYSNTHRLYGDTASALMKKYGEFSYINLSRLIGFDIDSYIYQNEYNNFFIFGTYNKNSKKFKSSKDNEISSSIIIADFISLINQFYFEKENKEENINYDFVTFSVPDYYSLYQKKELKLIGEIIGMKTINIINESSAITMYYGYNKYRDMFVTNKTNVNKTIKKNVIFIDIGYSKMNIIFSTFNYAEFKVEYVKSYPDLGGRDFDNKIMEYCLKDFRKKHPKIPPNQELLNLKLKKRFLEIIEKGRKALSINKETIILVESFYGNEDLECKIKKEEFEISIVRSELYKFEQYLTSFKKDLIEKKKYPEDLIVEMAGEFMRTPILQEITEKVFNISISKGILIDECTSVGAALYGYYINNTLPIRTFQNIYDFNYYQIKCFIPEINQYYIIKDSICDYYYNGFCNEIKLNDIKKKPKITLEYLYDKREYGQYYDSNKYLLLYKYEIDMEKFKELNSNYKYFDKIVITHYLYSIENYEKNNIEIYFTNGNLYYNENENKFYLTNEIIKCDYTGCINLTEEGINENIKEEYKNTISDIVLKQKKNDDEYLVFSKDRNLLSKKIYYYKNEIVKLNDENINKVLKEMNDYENWIKDLDKKDNLIEKKKVLENIKSNVDIKNKILDLKKKNKNEYEIFLQTINKIDLNNDKKKSIAQKRLSLLQNCIFKNN